MSRAGRVDSRSRRVRARCRAQSPAGCGRCDRAVHGCEECAAGLRFTENDEDEYDSRRVVHWLGTQDGLTPYTLVYDIDGGGYRRLVGRTATPGPPGTSAAARRAAELGSNFAN